MSRRFTLLFALLLLAPFASFADDPYVMSVPPGWVLPPSTADVTYVPSTTWTPYGQGGYYSEGSYTSYAQGSYYAEASYYAQGNYVDIGTPSAAGAGGTKTYTIGGQSITITAGDLSFWDNFALNEAVSAAHLQAAVVAGAAAHGYSAAVTTGPDGIVHVSCANGATPTDPLSCTTPQGSTLADGTSAVYYQAATVPYGTACLSQTRTCNDGTLSGSYANTSCMPLAADQCFFDGQTVAHGATVTAYQSASVPFGSTCSSQVRTCVSGTLGGSYAFPSCAVTAQNCTPQYSCAGQTVTYLNASCQQSSITTCTAPEFCSEGSAVCRSTPLTGSLSARPSLVRRRDPAYLFWQSAGAESCVVDGTNGDHWDLLNSGPLGFETSPIIQVTHFTLSCTPLSASGSTELIATATVSIAPSWQEI